MSVICHFKEDNLDFFPSITHIDGITRLYALSRGQNANAYGLLKEFEKLSGYFVLLNTFLNPRTESI